MTANTIKMSNQRHQLDGTHVDNFNRLKNSLVRLATLASLAEQLTNCLAGSGWFHYKPSRSRCLSAGFLSRMDSSRACGPIPVPCLRSDPVCRLAAADIGMHFVHGQGLLVKVGQRRRTVCEAI